VIDWEGRAPACHFCGFDRADPKGQQIAINVIANCRDGVLLWQVACELVAASRKQSVGRLHVTADIRHTISTPPEFPASPTF
jgi:hypothetical protein